MECKKYKVECPYSCGAMMQREKVNWLYYIEILCP